MSTFWKYLKIKFLVVEELQVYDVCDLFTIKLSNNACHYSWQNNTLCRHNLQAMSSLCLLSVQKNCSCRLGSLLQWQTWSIVTMLTWVEILGTCFVSSTPTWTTSTNLIKIQTYIKCLPNLHIGGWKGMATIICEK